MYLTAKERVLASPTEVLSGVTLTTEGSTYRVTRASL